MAELLAGVTIPSILSGAYSVLSTAYTLYGSTKSRREQVKLMLSRCDDLVTMSAKHALAQADLSEEMITGAARVQFACESVKGLIENLNRKGFVWCLLNADKIDAQVQASKEKIQDAFILFNYQAHFDVSAFQSDLIRAQIQDKEDLSALLYKLAENDRQILDAIQDQSGVYKRLEDLLIGVYKHVQHIPALDELSPEDRFLRTAADALGRKYNITTDRKFAAYILSSFEVEEYQDTIIGSGATGQVLTGEWRGSVVAIKRMHFQDARVINDKDRRTLRHEVKIWATLHHENILPLYGACPDADVPFLVMKYCQDGDVRHYIQKHPSADRLRLSCDVAIGLAFLHSKSIVHADIKGANVLVNGEQRALLTDFGLSIVMNDIRSRSTYSKELQDKARGTMAWMAPEVHNGSQPDMAADVYSLAMTIWEIFSGQSPFSGTRIEALGEVVRKGARPQQPPGFPQAVWDIIQGCWAQEPKSRPESKEAMLLLKSLIKTEVSSAPKVDTSFFGESIVAPLSRVGPTEFESIQTYGDSTSASWTTAKAQLVGSVPSTSQSSEYKTATQNSYSIPPRTTANNDSTLSMTQASDMPDAEDPIWTSFMQALPPQWKHVSWGARHYVDEVTLPLVLTDKPYKYRVVSGRNDLGIRETYELLADGSQRINFLEYNRGHGIVDSTHIKVFVVDPDGREAIVAYWDPRNKPIANIESEYARQVRANGVHWIANDSMVLSVALRRVLNNKEYRFRVISGENDLGVRPAGHPSADKTLTIGLAEYNGGQGIPTQTLIKVLVVDPDVGGTGTLIAGWWQPPGIFPTSLSRSSGSWKVDTSKSSLDVKSATLALEKGSSVSDLSSRSSPFVDPTSSTPPPPFKPASIASAPHVSTLEKSTGKAPTDQVKKKKFWLFK